MTDDISDGLHEIIDPQVRIKELEDRLKKMGKDNERLFLEKMALESRNKNLEEENKKLSEALEKFREINDTVNRG